MCFRPVQPATVGRLLPRSIQPGGRRNSTGYLLGRMTSSSSVPGIQVHRPRDPRGRPASTKARAVQSVTPSVRTSSASGSQPRRRAVASGSTPQPSLCGKSEPKTNLGASLDASTSSIGSRGSGTHATWARAASHRDKVGASSGLSIDKMGVPSDRRRLRSHGMAQSMPSSWTSTEPDGPPGWREATHLSKQRCARS